MDDAVFFLDTSSQATIWLRGTAPSRDPWLFDSPYEFKIKVTLGTTPFATAFTDTFDVIVSDTCLDTQLITRDLGPYVATYDGGLQSFTNSPFLDTISDQYSGAFGDGTGFDLCGARTYELFVSINGQN